LLILLVLSEVFRVPSPVFEGVSWHFCGVCWVIGLEDNVLCCVDWLA